LINPRIPSFPKSARIMIRMIRRVKKNVSHFIVKKLGRV